MTDDVNVGGVCGLSSEALDDSGKMAALELKMSETTEAGLAFDVILDPLPPACGVPVDGALASGSCVYVPEGPQEPEPGCCDMPVEEYDPGSMDLSEESAEDAMAREIEELALAEPEPPEGM